MLLVLLQLITILSKMVASFSDLKIVIKVTIHFLLINVQYIFKKKFSIKTILKPKNTTHFYLNFFLFPQFFTNILKTTGNF